MLVDDEFYEEKQNRIGGLKSDQKGSMCSTSDRVVKEDLSIKAKQNNKTRKRWREKSNYYLGVKSVSGQENSAKSYRWKIPDVIEEQQAGPWSRE